MVRDVSTSLLRGALPPEECCREREEGSRGGANQTRPGFREKETGGHPRSLQSAGAIRGLLCRNSSRVSRAWSGDRAASSGQGDNRRGWDDDPDSPDVSLRLAREILLQERVRARLLEGRPSQEVGRARARDGRRFSLPVQVYIR